MDHYVKMGSSSKNLTQSIKNNCFAGLAWNMFNKRKREERKRRAVGVREDIIGKKLPEFQEDEFVFIVADVSALYPSLDQVETAGITANAVRESNVCFQNVSYDELAVYLALTIGKEGMNKWGV